MRKSRAPSVLAGLYVPPKPPPLWEELEEDES